MKIIVTNRFRRNYKQRIKGKLLLEEAFRESLLALINNPQDPNLHDHQLEGSMKKLRAFSVDYDVRVIYKQAAQGMILLDIGNHREVYS